MDLAVIQKRSGLTAADLAAKLRISKGHMADLKSGRRSLTLPLAAKLEEVTGATGLVDAVVKARTSQTRAA